MNKEIEHMLKEQMDFLRGENLIDTKCIDTEFGNK